MRQPTRCNWNLAPIKKSWNENIIPAGLALLRGEGDGISRPLFLLVIV
jgi:hypothetical protein